MYKICNTPKTMKVQHEYIKQLYYLMERKPYNKISIQDICNSANGSRRSFYRYFKNKDGCLCALLDMVITRYYYTPMPPEIRKEGYPDELLAFVHYHRQREGLYDLLLRDGLYERYAERVVECAKHNGIYSLRWFGISEGSFSEDTLVFQIYGMLAVLKNWHLSGYKRSLYEMADVLCHLIPGEWNKFVNKNNDIKETPHGPDNSSEP